MIYRKLDGTTLYLRGDAQDGYEEYTGSYIAGSKALNQTLTSVVVENAISYSGDIRHIFYYCSALTSLDLSNFDVSNATNMYYMFAYCSSLTSLNVSNFDTSNVTNMSFMFDHCSALTSLNVSNFDTSNVTTMRNMFEYCSSLTSLNISNFDTSNVTTMYAMFYYCSSLTSLNVSNFDTSNVTSMSGMFDHCSALTSLNVSNFDTSNVTTMYDMFEYCSSLTSLNVSKFDTSNVTDMMGMFNHCSALTILDLSNFDTSNVTNFSYSEAPEAGYSSGMFAFCSSLRRLQIDNFTKSSNTYAYGMFYGCTSLTTIECKNTFATGYGTDMFTGCTSLQGETAKGGIAYSSSKTGPSYAKINGGYFTYPKRTLTTSVTGDGTINNVAGTYDYGTTIDLIATPNSQTYYYLSQINKTINGVTTQVYNTHTIEAYTYSFSLEDDTSVSAAFVLRNQYTIAVTSTYTIQGAGTYRYLDQPTLIAQLGGGLIMFDGWYSGSTKLSDQNPWTFTMPDNSLNLTIQTGTNPFSNEKIRQFCLQNSKGGVYNLTSKDSNIFLSSPNGLGFDKKVTVSRFGNAEEVSSEQFTLPTISGEIAFIDGDNQDRYSSYHNFVRFISNSPITLWYKIPKETHNIFHVPVEITSLSKGEVGTDNILRCNITMSATGLWKETEVVSSSAVKITNDGDVDIGIEITLSKLDGTAFTNPILTFNNGEEYGVCAIDSIEDQAFTQIKINTKDGEQDIVLKNGSTTITNPFSYIDFSNADGVKQFPFPKLMKGYETTLNFTYDGATESDVKSYSISYDKEYISV